MPTLRFKSRPGSSVVQLVNYVYSPARKRSATLLVGSCRLDADPGLLPLGVRLAKGTNLSFDDLEVLRTWLTAHGDPQVRMVRERRDRLTEERLRAKIAGEARSTEGQRPLQDAASALQGATVALERLAEDCAKVGKDPWTLLRPDYLAVYRAWMEFTRTARGAGVAKQSRRESVST